MLDGVGNLARLYRLWRRNFDGWLLANGECPRPDQVFLRFANGLPANARQTGRMTLYIPLEEVSDRKAIRRLSPFEPGSVSA